jgi:GNAT superfamily N-acetyltransferase
MDMRQGVAADAVAIRELTRAAYAKWVPLIDDEPRPMRADYAEALKTHRFDLVIENGAMVALVETAAESDHLLIVNVAVLPSHQGRGFGHRLLAHAEALAREAGYTELRLYTNQMFTLNIRLYESVGYVFDHEESFGRHTIVHMKKVLGQG